MDSSTKNPAPLPKDIWQWQWQSNPNPWDKAEQPQWTSYSPQENYLIEKAYFDQKKEIQIGCYIISIKHKIQSDKGDAVKQRPIRRKDLTNDIQEIDRSERYFETELPKTTNPLFGSLRDFETFFSRRNQSIRDFAKYFKELEESNDLEILNNKIAPQLAKCLEELLLKPIEEEGKNTSLSFFKKKMLSKVKELISPYKNPFLSFEEFYGQILKAYTMQTSLYSNLNEYLRNENWIEIDKLLPYAFILCKTFSNPKLKANLTQVPSSMFLYRGTAFDESALCSYDKKRIQQFSWYSVTSTTASEDVAKGFMFKAANIAKKKYPVLFVIEIPLADESEEEKLTWIDVQQYSAISKEKEVILAPGSVFEVVDVSTDKDNVTTIKIKLINKIKSLAHRGMMMQGTLQSQMMTEKEAKVMCLEGEELSQALMSLHGNTLIEEAEFSLCTFNAESLNKLFEILLTLKKAKELKFRACIYQEKEGLIIERPKKGEKCEITKIGVVEANDFFQMICNESRNQEYWACLRELDLDFGSQQTLRDEELSAAASQGLQHLPQLTYLKINLGYCEQISDEGVNSLAQGLNHLIQLMDLDLNFEWCQKITDKGFHSLMEGLNSLTKLINLTLNFKECQQITDTGMESLSQRLNSFTQLRHLNLNLRLFTKITDVGMNSFSQGLISLTQLSHLNLDFGWCVKLTDHGMYSLTECLNSLTQLTYLNLHLGGWKELTSQGVSHLMSQGIKKLAQLASLILDFDQCGQITRQYLDLLALISRNLLNSGIPLVVKKDRLQNIDIQAEEQFDDSPRVKLVREGFCQEEHKRVFYEKVYLLQKAPTELVQSEKNEKRLTKNFMAIMDSAWRKDQNMLETMKIGQTLLQYRQETSLTFYFENSSITDEFVHIFSSQVLSNLPQLRSLTIDFDHCYNMTDEGIRNLAFYGLKHLTGLTSLKLKFFVCESVTEGGLTDLAQEGLRNLSQLKSFTLFVFRSAGITDKGLINLARHGLCHLFQLETLCLQFDERVYVSDVGVDGLVLFGLRNLTQLKFLVLCLAGSAITDNGANNLVQRVVKNLYQLVFFDINLFGCSNVSASTVQNLRNILHYYGFTKEIDEEKGTLQVYESYWRTKFKSKFEANYESYECDTSYGKEESDDIDEIDNIDDNDDNYYNDENDDFF